MAYPNSSAISAGDAGLATQYNNLRNDAIGVIDILSAGVFSARQVIKNEGGGFLLFNNQWKPVNCEILIAASSGAGGLASATAYKPGSIIPGFAGALVTDAIYYADNSGNLSTTPGRISIKIGVALNTSTLLFNPEIGSLKMVSSTSGDANSVGDVLYLKSDGKWWRALGTVQESGHAKAVGFSANSCGGADVALNVIVANQIVSGFSGLTTGAIYYTSNTIGGISTTRGNFSRPLGIALSTTKLAFFPLEPNENFVIESVVAGENWTGNRPLYFNKTDQRYYRSDSDVAISGICEFPAIGLANHTGGAGSVQLVYMPGSVIRGSIGFGTGDRLFPSATVGVFAGNTPPSYDTFWRVYGYMQDTNTLVFNPQQMEFLPTGIQEKGFASSGGDAGGGVGDAVRTPIVFQKTMVNTPSSLTMTLIDGLEYDPPSIENINRRGAAFALFSSTGSGLFYWDGTYQTVGN